ncbi:MAG: hypothetical protein AB7K24_21020 [Gemmataceae bacterium]
MAEPQVFTLRAKPGDTVFIRVPEKAICAERAEVIKAQLGACVPEGVKVGILTAGMEIVHLSVSSDVVQSQFIGPPMPIQQPQRRSYS